MRSRMISWRAALSAPLRLERFTCCECTQRCQANLAMATEASEDVRLQLGPRLKVWVESGNGKIVLSDYRVRLLEAVARTGSLADSSAALVLFFPPPLSY